MFEIKACRFNRMIEDNDRFWDNIEFEFIKADSLFSPFDVDAFTFTDLADNEIDERDWQALEGEPMHLWHHMQQLWDHTK